MKIRYNLLFILLSLFFTSCLEYEDTMTPKGKITELNTLTGNFVNTVLSPDSKYWYCIYLSNGHYPINEMRKWSLETGEITNVIKSGSIPNTGSIPDTLLCSFINLSISNDGKKLAAMATDYQFKYFLMIWDLVQDTLELLYYPTTRYNSLRFSPDSKKLFAMYFNKQNDQNISMCFEIFESENNNFSKNKRDTLILKYDGPYYYSTNVYFRFSGNGEYISFLSPSYVKLQDNQTIIRVMNDGCAALNYDASLMYIVYYNVIRVYETQSFKLVSSFPDFYVSSNDYITVSPNDKFFVTSYTLGTGEDNLTTKENGLQAWNSKNGQLIGRIKTSSRPSEITFINENRFYALYKGKVTLYEINE